MSTTTCPGYWQAVEVLTRRVTGCCGLNATCSSDADVEAVMVVHAEAHQAAAPEPVWTAEEEAAAQVVRDVFAPVMDAGVK
jgi:hypothetical protein